MENKTTNEQPPEWVKYWAEVAPKLMVHLQGNTDARIIRYLVNCIAIYSWLTEDWKKKATKHTNLRGKLSIFLVETQDIMRGILAAYEHMTMAPLALIARTALEIRVNLRYIVKSEDPGGLADLFDRFQNIEKMLGQQSSKEFASPTEDEIEQIAKICPEWFELGTKKLKDKRRLNWTGTSTNLRAMAETNWVGLGDEYISLYKVNSKFTHASPLIQNMYRKGDRLQSIPSPQQCGDLALLAMVQCMYILTDACEFFGVDFPDYDYALVCSDALEAMGGGRLDPKAFPVE